ncbi:G-patch domain and KOW motifs-containing protein [Pipistrellus kuhlii]|uniref:G-patch domain and KOW motifs-containing protein n=1 Tax=Pipistrellus kuhlii TaxID=59472 RepID=A0A7J7SFX4_PIPKU|nr:G-patch domain and KOW motifs-containing protein [Pipistrellus kuhlii]KAF6287268.1 hypothetical protein mPipKuh1_009961 [Pipistrellus kuhlii]
MIQNRRIPSEKGADRKPRAKAVPNEADYEAVPVEAGGLAMLQGMGWKPGQGIGCTFSEVVRLHVNTPRPKGLGLITNQIELQALAPTSPLRLLRPDAEHEEDKEDQPPGLAPGGAVVDLSGPPRGLYGI